MRGPLGGQHKHAEDLREAKERKAEMSENIAAIPGG